LSSASPYSLAPQPSYDSAYDTAFPDGIFSAYANVGSDDCVIAARAHHTIRLVYAAGRPIPAITDPEVTEEYGIECNEQGTDGLVLSISLQDWKSRGWRAGGVSGRTIAGFNGVGGVTLAATGAGSTGGQLSELQVMTYIFQNTGAIANLRLPSWLNAPTDDNFGPGNDWGDTSQIPMIGHTMLLTGYNEAGPIGITWGKRQQMSWPFLAKYCSGALSTGLWVVQANNST